MLTLFAGIPRHDQILDEIYSALCADENRRAKVLKIERINFIYSFIPLGGF